jgi:hypothetical protein
MAAPKGFGVVEKSASHAAQLAHGDRVATEYPFDVRADRVVETDLVLFGQLQHRSDGELLGLLPILLSKSVLMGAPVVRSATPNARTYSSPISLSNF